jgi:hypothetical protein
LKQVFRPLDGQGPSALAKKTNRKFFFERSLDCLSSSTIVTLLIRYFLFLLSKAQLGLKRGNPRKQGRSRMAADTILIE